MIDRADMADWADTADRADMADRADRAGMAGRTDWADKSEIMNHPLTGPQHQLLEDAIASKNHFIVPCCERSYDPYMNLPKRKSFTI